MKTFSEHGEDKLILNHFYSRIKSGYIGKYLDIGCFHETERSNTKLLNICGWDGIAVDANPDLMDTWLRGRPNDLFLNAAISPAIGTTQYKKIKSKMIGDSLKFYRFIGAQVSTIDRELAEKYVRKGFSPRDTISVQSITINQLARFLAEKEPSFYPDFVNIDIERVDYLDDLSFFLESLKFPEYLCLEWVSHGYNFNNMMKSREYGILSDLNYIVESIGNNLHCTRPKAAIIPKLT